MGVLYTFQRRLCVACLITIGFAEPRTVGQVANNRSYVFFVSIIGHSKETII